MISLFNKKFFPPGFVFLVFVTTSILLRIALMFKSGSNAHMHFSEYIFSFIIGILYDVYVAFVVIIPFVLYIWLQNNLIYREKVVPIVIGFFILVIGLLVFTNIVPKEFNAQIFKILLYYIIFRFALYLLMAFVSAEIRAKLRVALMNFMLSVTCMIILFNAVSEWFFWEEFSTRYNFIAVDYLIYTNEVLGNVKESYPIYLIVSILFLIVFVMLFSIRKKISGWATFAECIQQRTWKALLLILVPIFLYFIVQEKWHHYSKNEFADELAGNGIYQFGVAFQNNDLDFYKFYRTIPNADAFNIVRKQLQDSNSTFNTQDSFNIERKIVSHTIEKKLNVVLISVESLSGSYMQHFGSTENITPYLDSLAEKSMFFLNLYASGTITVRGLEALTLSLPPVPGQSIIKRPDNANMFTIGSVFRSKGYVTQYIYGGYSYFDNMKAFFSGNGYEVIDRSAIKPSDIHYQNIWGVADEDEFTLAINTLDKNYKNKKPFFTHIMTVSNHRPFTYPDGRIDIPSNTQSRNGAVKYTDYCINKFITEAASKPWYDSTIFVIVSDHCAGSAGSVQLPVTGYHIPLLIFSPKNITPSTITDLTAQIDIAPTVLGLLGFSYNSKFIGQDVLHTSIDKRQAFISTYQGLGFIKGDQLLIQSPVKKINQYKPDFKTGAAINTNLDENLVKMATSFYQTAAWLIKNKKYNK